MRRLALLLVLAGCVATTKDPVEKRSPREDALAELEARPSNYDNEWRAAQLCGEIADEGVEGRSRSQREEFARRGLAHAERAIKLNPEAVEGHFYRLIDLGRLVDAQRIPASELVAEMRDEGERTARIDERFDYAGAHRFLAILYSKAPETGPYGVGDLQKAEQHFNRALQLAGDYPENLLAYAHYQLEKMDNKEGARDAAKKALDAARAHPGLLPEQRASLEREAEDLLKDCE